MQLTPNHCHVRQLCEEASDKVFKVYDDDNIDTTAQYCKLVYIPLTGSVHVVMCAVNVYKSTVTDDNNGMV